jgi:hypothetical protein
VFWTLAGCSWSLEFELVVVTDVDQRITGSLFWESSSVGCLGPGASLFFL